jgi:hypothetical protein
MAWSAPPTWTTGQTITAAFLNQLRDNLNETAVAKATTSGSYAVSTAANALSERSIGFDTIATQVSHTNTAFSDLTASVGPTVTVTCGARCIGMHSSYLENSTVNLASLTALEVTGATSVTPTDNFALSMTSSTANSHLRASWVMVYEMTAGVNVFKMKYRVSGGTGQFAFRRLTVVPY